MANQRKRKSTAVPGTITLQSHKNRSIQSDQKRNTVQEKTSATMQRNQSKMSEKAITEKNAIGKKELK